MISIFSKMEYIIFIIFFIILYYYISKIEYFKVDYMINFRSNYYDLNNVNFFNNIPKIVFQSFRTRELPKAYINYHKILVNNNKDFIFYYYNDNDCFNFMKNYDPIVFKAYKKIKNSKIRYMSGAGGSDLFRYCILEKYGGIWLDMGMELVSPLNDIFGNIINKEKNQFITSLAINKKSVFQAIICCTKNHPFLKKAIKKICNLVLDNNILDKLIIYKNPIILNRLVWEITGPTLLANIITNYKLDSLKKGWNKNDSQDKFYLFYEIFSIIPKTKYFFIKDKNKIIICSRCIHAKNGSVITKKN